MIAEMKLPTLNPAIVSGMATPSSPATPPLSSVISGLMMSVVSAVTMAVNAPPMVTPTAMSMALPLSMNSLNSSKRLFFSSAIMVPFYYVGILVAVCDFTLVYNKWREK